MSHRLSEALRTVRFWEHTPLHEQTQRRVPRPLLRSDFGGLESRVADTITSFTGSMRFVYVHTVWFGGWITMNVGLLALFLGGKLVPFDPYPFGLLTLIVSLEAIYLSTFVMISQNRLSQLADKRSEADYQVNVQAAHDVAKVLALLTALAEHHANEQADNNEQAGDDAGATSVRI